MGRTINKAEYALYKGDKLLGIGTLDELAEQQGVTRNTIYYYSMPAYQRRGSDKGKRKIAVRLD